MQNSNVSDHSISDKQAMKNVRNVVFSLVGVTIGLIVAVVIII